MAGTFAAPSIVTQLTALVFTDIVGSTAAKATLGTSGYVQLLARHNALFEEALSGIDGARIIKHTGDGYFAAFATASDAVRFALRFQSQMASETWGSMPLTTRLGIHIGEVQSIVQAGQQDVTGYAADLAARLMGIAAGGQILLTRQAFDDARQFVRELPADAVGLRETPLRWLAHGPYRFKGADELLDVFEVGIEGISPLSPPPGSDKGKRAVNEDDDPTLGWRPAIGLAVPGRNHWTLVGKLGEGGFGEVWLAKHHKLNQKRVFKFCFDADRLRSLKREFTLFRLLKEALGNRPDIATLYEVRLDEPPFFLESEYTAGGDLTEWAQRQGGIGAVPLQSRLQILAQIADAVAAAHSVGILHKDIKPSNVLIDEEPASENMLVQPRLADFGIGQLADKTALRQHAITETGFTQITEDPLSSRTGTRLYAPPESLAHAPPTTQGDVYSLGVMVYQFVVGDLSRPLAVGWERDVDDAVFREDIAAMTEGDPTRRLATAAEAAVRLRSVDARRADRANVAAEAERVMRRRRRRRWAMATAAVFFPAALVATAAIVQNVESRRRARDAEARAESFGMFVSNDLVEELGKADLANGAGRGKGEQFQNAVIGDVLRGVSTRLDDRFSDQPQELLRLRRAFAGALIANGDLVAAQQQYEAVDELARQLRLNDPTLAAEVAAGRAVAYWRRGEAGGLDVIRTEIARLANDPAAAVAVASLKIELAKALKNTTREKPLVERLAAVDEATAIFRDARDRAATSIPADAIQVSELTTTLAEMSIERGNALLAEARARGTPAGDAARVEGEALLETALTQLRDALALAQRTVGERSGPAVEAGSELAKQLHRLGRAPEAVDAYREAVALSFAVYGTSHWRSREMAVSWINLHLTSPQLPGAAAAFDRVAAAYLAPNDRMETWLSQDLVKLRAAIDKVSDPQRANDAAQWVRLDELLRKRYADAAAATTLPAATSPTTTP